MPSNGTAMWRIAMPAEGPPTASFQCSSSCRSGTVCRMCAIAVGRLIALTSAIACGPLYLIMIPCPIDGCTGAWRNIFVPRSREMFRPRYDKSEIAGGCSVVVIPFPNKNAKI